MTTPNKIIVRQFHISTHLGQGCPQSDARDARASSKSGPKFYFFFILNFEFSRFFSFTPTSELISFHFL